jgi:Flp pilus assembly protein TadG
VNWWAFGSPQPCTPKIESATHRNSDRGQAAVELALTWPVIAIFLLATVQVGVAIRNELAVEHAAREGARAAAVTTDAAGAAAAAAQQAVSLPLQVSTVGTTDDVTVTVTYVDPTDVALIGWAIGPVTHRASATMAVEPP